MDYSTYLQDTHTHAIKYSGYYYEQWLTYLLGAIKNNPFRHKRASRFIDVGCGTGPFLTCAKSAYFADWQGIDANKKNVVFAQAKGLKVSQQSLDQWRHKILAQPGQYTGIVCAHVLEHIEAKDRARAADTLYNALHAGGRLVLVVPKPLTSWSYWNDPTHKTPVTKRQIEILFNDKDCTITFVDFHFPGLKALRAKSKYWPIYTWLLAHIPIRWPIAITAYIQKKGAP